MPNDTRNQPTPDERPDHGEADPPERLTRRRLVVGAAGLAGALATAPALGASLPAGLLLGDDDHDDDKDDRDDDKDDDKDDHNDDHEDDDHLRTASEAGILEVHIIDDDEDGFFPGLLKVEVGETVTFINDDDKDHTATGSDWDTGRIEPGGSAEISFDEAGSYQYSCQFHPEMLGTIEVGAAGTPEASPVASPEAAGGAETMVAIVNFAFDPAEIEVAVGATVTWTNEDSAPHTATALDDAFDTGTLNQGEQGSHTFTEAGTFEYQCAIHPSMTGTVIVS